MTILIEKDTADHWKQNKQGAVKRGGQQQYSDVAIEACLVYGGLDVKEKESGTSVKDKPRISKRGNRFLRKAMHMPALSAIPCDEHFKAFYERLVAKHGIKMKAVVAVQRKLLEMMYTLYKTGKKYDKDYLEKQRNQAA